MKPFFIALPLAVIILACIVFLWQKSKPKILVTPAKALIDVPVEISISNLSPHEHIALEASCKDKDNNVWISHVTFQANDKGVVNVATQAPFSGSYKEIDPMGLFWSMTPTNRKAPFFSSDKSELEILLSVFSQNKLRAQKTAYRLLISPDIEKRQIREQGIVGTLFFPKNTKRGPGVIVVSGSDGGISKTTSQLLASHGYVVLALGYFAVEGLPDKLENISLEYFQNAMQWFKKQSEVGESSIALFGGSRGGELVLLLATTFPKEMDAVIAYVPSSLIYGGFPQHNNLAWIYKNSPIPFMPSPRNEEILNAIKEGKMTFHKGTFEDPYEITSNFLYGMNKFHKAIEAATIPVENIRCPILIFSGEDDKMWPSSLYGKLIIERLDKKRSSIERKHLHFSGAGHGFEFPYVPSTDSPYYHSIGKFWCTLGGTAEGNARASKESWEEVLDFLKKHLK